MQTYWDLEEKERGALTREEVERFLDAELMTKGVLKVAPFIFEAEPQIDEPEKRTFYATEFPGFVFETAAQADAFYALRPRSTKSEYLNGDYRQSVLIADDESAVSEIKESRAVSRGVFEASKSGLQRRAAIRSANEKKSSEYERQSKEQDKVLSGVWEDWARCRAVDAEHRRLLATFREYERVAGNSPVAAKFLGKVFTKSQIADAAEWLSVVIPDCDAPETLPAPVPEPDSKDIPF